MKAHKASDMAHRHTPYPRNEPGHIGELQLAKQLSTLPDDHLHVWFSVNAVPSVPDIDLIIWHERAGVFVIEVKAVFLDEIEYFGWNRCKISGRAEDLGPQQQAHNAVHFLKNYLEPTGEAPWITSVACWPKIRRVEWNARWDDDRVCGEYSESMLFLDDVCADSTALLERLKRIWYNPSIGRHPTFTFRHDSNQFEAFQRSLDVKACPKATVNDYERLRTLEGKIRQEVIKEVLPYSGSHVIYSGRPGTGKTFRLLQLAIYGSEQEFDGRPVL